jgi:hypothetical protein
MLRRSSSPYCFALYLRPKAVKVEAAPHVPALDAAAMSMSPSMFLLGQMQMQQQQQQQQQHMVGSPGAQYVLGGMQQQEGLAGNMFLPGDFQHHQSSMFMLPSAAESTSPQTGAFS